MKEKLFKITKDSKSLSICADFWTGKDGLGYLGITASILLGSVRKNYLIALRHINHPHTGIVVAQSIENILREYGIDGLDDPKVISISTDNGSNMVAGLKNFAVIPIDEDCVEEVEMDENIADDEISDDAFSEVCYSKRIPCTNHILNNNLKKAIKSCEPVRKIIREAKNLIKKLRFKGTVIDYMREKKLNKLLLPPKTRWQYCYQMLTSLIAIKSSVSHLCSLAGVDNLTIAQYEEIESLLKILTLYSVQIKKFEAADSKLSDAIPAIMNLDAELLEITDHEEFTSLLRNDLRTRTKCMFDPSHKSFNLIFALSTFLDPSVKRYFKTSFLVYDMVPLKELVISKLRRIIDCSTTTTHEAKKPKVFKALDKYTPPEIEDGDEISQ